MARKAPGNNIVRGVDVSDYQEKLNWDQFAAMGKQFAYVKCAENGVASKLYKTHTANARKSGLIPGAYFFFHAKKAWEPQVDGFLKILSRKPGDLPCAIDVERNKQDGSAALTNAAAANILLCIQKISAETGADPFIYTQASFFKGLKDPSPFAKYPCWIAEYNNVGPTVPSPWKSWAIWQYTSGYDSSEKQDIDSNIFNGTIDQLKKYCI